MLTLTPVCVCPRHRCRYAPLLRALRALPAPWRAVRIDAHLGRAPELLVALLALAAAMGARAPASGAIGECADAAAPPASATPAAAMEAAGALAPGTSDVGDVLRAYAGVARAAGRAAEALRTLPSRGGVYAGAATALVLEVARLAEARAQWSDACAAYLCLEPPRVCVLCRAGRGEGGYEHAVVVACAFANAFCWVWA